MGIKKNIFFLSLFLISIIPASGQVNFALHAEDGVRLIDKGAELIFGTVTPPEDSPIEIRKIDDLAVLIAIEGIAYLDVDVEFTTENTVYPDNYLLLQGDPLNNKDQHRLPVELKMAYFNQAPRGEATMTDDDIKQAAIEVVGNMATFQIRRRPGGPPGPPPVPPHSGYEPPIAKAYLVFYGTLTVENVIAGPYYETINVHVSYSTYE